MTLQANNKIEYAMEVEYNKVHVEDSQMNMKRSTAAINLKSYAIQIFR